MRDFRTYDYNALENQLGVIKECQLALSDLRIHIRKIEDALGVVEPEIAMAIAYFKHSALHAPAPPRSSSRAGDAERTRHWADILPDKPKSTIPERKPEYAHSNLGEGKKKTLPDHIREFFARPG